MTPVVYLIAAVGCTWLLFTLDRLINTLRGKR